MLAEVSTLRKHKISLQDYDYKQDIENRLLLAEFSIVDLEVLEEILYSSLRIPLVDLACNLEMTDATLIPILSKLSSTGLFTFNNIEILVDKEKRKYFEAQLSKFHSDFKPNMEYLQSLLKKVPIHVLPSWYAIPRTSNNIFDSLIEKYLLTPTIFERHITDVSSCDPIAAKIIEEVFSSPSLQVDAEFLIQKFHLSKESFEEILLLLEFHLICALSYVQEEGHWKEIVTPFHEWKEYLSTLNARKISPIPSTEKIGRLRPREFSFIEDAYRVLGLAKKAPFQLSEPTLQTLKTLLGGFARIDEEFIAYIKRILSTLERTELIENKEGIFYPLTSADEWLVESPEERALHLYRHPAFHLHDKHHREAEKSLAPIAHLGWVYFDTFIENISVPLHTSSPIKLHKQGKTWKYVFPEYSADEKTLIKKAIFGFLFEVGAVTLGSHQGKECFAVTSFGKTLL